MINAKFYAKFTQKLFEKYGDTVSVIPPENYSSKEALTFVCNHPECNKNSWQATSKAMMAARQSYCSSCLLRERREHFLNRLSELDYVCLNPDDYEYVTTYLNYRCNKHPEYTWTAQACEVLKGNSKCQCCFQEEFRGNWRQEYLSKLKEAHPTFICLNPENYYNQFSELQVRCSVCSNEWSAKACEHLKKWGCSDCQLKRRRVKFLSDLKRRFGGAIECFNPQDYKTISEPLQFICTDPMCNCEWIETPFEILNYRSNCKSKTNFTGASGVAIAWLEHIEKQWRVEIRHANNLGEYRVENFKVDGYSHEINTIFEFHGSAFHGDPNLYYRTDTPNGFKPELTAEEMFEYTVAREKRLMYLGYKLYHIWESDYWQGVKEGDPLKYMREGSSEYRRELFDCEFV